MINALHAMRLREAFGPNSAVFECMTDAEIVNIVNDSRESYKGYSGDVEEWVEIEIIVNKRMNGFNWDDNRSEEYNLKAREETEAWLATVNANARETATMIAEEIKNVRFA